MGNLKINIKKILTIFSVFLLALSISLFTVGCSKNDEKSNSDNTESLYKVSEEEKAYLKERFDGLKKINNETIGYIYAPGTKLDEPIVQTTDNATYLDKSFEGTHAPFLGSVFMDMDNKKDFSDRLTWLFGHARGSKVVDHRMFNDVNFYEKQDYFDKHPYLVIETPSRKYYYEAAFLTVVPEDTEYYTTSFDNDADFIKNLSVVKSSAKTKNDNVKIDSKYKYLVLCTCREDGEEIRSLLYFRQIPDNELTEFVEKNKDKLKYEKTR